MRSIDVGQVKDSVRQMCIEACTELGVEMTETLKAALQEEPSSVGKEVLRQLIENAEIARSESIALCQDTGFAVIFLEVGQEVTFTGGYLYDAVTEGVRQAYTEGYLRKSILKNPLTRPENTKDNTPAIIHTEIVPGDRVKITVLPKGGGSENVSRVAMLRPADGIEGVKNFVIETVKNGGANSCPPIIVGVGVGGTFDYVAYLAKKALLRKPGQRNADARIAKYETEWLKEINKLGIGPGGLGGRVTALELFIEVFARHIATFPVAVNIQCNATRCESCIL